jgi:hypothetical protein
MINARLHRTLSSAKVNIPGAQLINALNDVIHGSMVQLKTPSEVDPHPFLCMLTPSGQINLPMDSMHTSWALQICHF